MFNAKPLELPHQLEWKYIDEPVLAEWSVRARPYNTDVANGICIFMLVVQTPFLVWLLSRMTLGLAGQLIVGGALLTVTMSGVLSMTHQRTNFAYRLTASGLEFCEWKVFPEWIPQLLKWLAIITGVGMLLWAMTDPALIIGAIVGPGLIGLMYLRMGTSKEFRSMHETYHHVIQSWSEFDKIIVFRRRSIIGLCYTWYNADSDEGVDKMINSTRKIYCKRTGFDELIEIIKARLPESAPYTEAYIPIYA